MASYQSYGGALQASYTLAKDGNVVVNLFDQRIRRKRLSFPAFFAANTSVTTLTAGSDQIAVVPIFNGEVVKTVYFRLVTAAATATTTLQVKDNAAGILIGVVSGTQGAASASGGVWTAAVVANGTAGVYGPSALTGSILANGSTNLLGGLGKYYTANGSLDVVIAAANFTSAAETACVVEVIAELLEIVPQASN